MNGTSLWTYKLSECLHLSISFSKNSAVSMNGFQVGADRGITEENGKEPLEKSLPSIPNFRMRTGKKSRVTWQINGESMVTFHQLTLCRKYAWLFWKCKPWAD